MEFINNSISVDCENACLKYVVMCILVHQRIIYANNLGIIGLPMEFDVQGHPLGMVYDDIVLGRKPKCIKNMLDFYSSRADILACASYSLLDVNRINSPDYFLSGTIGCLGDGRTPVDKEMVFSHCLYKYNRLSIGCVETNPAETYAAYVYAMKEVRDAFRESAFVKMFMSNCDNRGWKNVADAHLSLKYSNYDTACELLSGDNDFSVVADIGRYLLLGGLAAAAYVSLQSDIHNGQSNRGDIADFKSNIGKVISSIKRVVLPFMKNGHVNVYGRVIQDDLVEQLESFFSKLQAQEKWLKVLDKSHKRDEALLIMRIRHAIGLAQCKEKGDELCIQWVGLVANILDISVDRKLILDWINKYMMFRPELAKKEVSHTVDHDESIERAIR